MRPSLNEIVENLAFSLGEQFNMTLRESLKHTIGLYREKLLREEDFNSVLNYNDFTQNVVMPLEEWTHDICGVGRITKEEIPKSIRFKTRGRVNYYFIGDSIFTNPYIQTTFAEFEYVKLLRYHTNKFYYVIENDKIIILNNGKLCDIGIKGVFSNPSLLQRICNNVSEVDDDASYPLGGDLLTIIRKGILSGEYPIRQVDEEGVITSDSTDNK